MSWLVDKSSNWKLRLFSLATGLLAIFEAKKSHAIQGLAVAAIGIAIVGFFFVRSWISNKLATIGYSIAVGIIGFIALLGVLQSNLNDTADCSDCLGNRLFCGSGIS